MKSDIRNLQRQQIKNTKGISEYYDSREHVRKKYNGC